MAGCVECLFHFVYLGRGRAWVVATLPRLPHSEPTKERFGVAAQPAAEGRLLQLLRVSAADDEVVQEKRGREPFDPERDGLAPLLLPELLEPARS